MKDHPLQLNFVKLELLVVSANPTLHHNFSILLGLSSITPSRTGRNLGVVIDDQLNFTEHIARTARSCRFALYNIMRIRPFLSELHNSWSKLLSYPDWIIVKPLQLIQMPQQECLSSHLSSQNCTGCQSQFDSNSRHWCWNNHWLCSHLHKLTTPGPCVSRSLCSASERRLVA